MEILRTASQGTGRFEYGAKSPIGTFSDSLMDEAKQDGWTVISIKDDWQTVVALEKQ